jgi:hypothetical protein
MTISRFATLGNFRFIALAFLFSLTSLAHAGDSKTQKQNEIRKTAEKTLQKLYMAQPSARAAVENAAGYAVFKNTGVKILVAGSGKGKGMAVSNKTKKGAREFLSTEIS